MNRWGRLSVPVMSDEFAKWREEYLKALTTCGADTVFLCVRRDFDLSSLAGQFEVMAENVKCLKAKGYKVGCWYQSFGFGNPVPAGQEEMARFTKITDPDGKVGGDAFCPEDEKYTEFMANETRMAAGTGVDFLVLDDDMCLNIRPGIGCACDRHMEMFAHRLGRPVDRQALRSMLYRGGPSQERREWMGLMGDSLRDFCRAMRRAADEVNPDLPMGFCAGFTSWDMEGVDAIELTRILAGKNRPFLRLSGAPYWAPIRRFPAQSMAHIVEFTRMQANWCRKADVDYFTENDSYPRPAYRVNAAYIETFDFCMTAAGEDRQLKYLMDYYSRPDYETAYVEAHARNRERILRAGKAMEGMKYEGIYIHQDMRVLDRMDIPHGAGDGYVMHASAFASAAEMISGLGIPTTYENHGGIAAAFGCMGRSVPLTRQKGYILDFTAAMELERRGVDTGLVGGCEASGPMYEYFPEDQDRIELNLMDTRAESRFYRAELKAGARVQSVFDTGREKYPASYRYENAQGQKFWVLLARGDTLLYGGSLTRSYLRQKQVVEFCRWAGCPVAAYAPKKPDVYVICGRKEGEMALAACNFSLDDMYDLAFRLGDTWKSAWGDGCEAEAAGETLTVKHLAPYGFAVIRLTK